VITGPAGSPVRLYAHRPDELRSEIVSAGFSDVEVLASTGSLLWFTDVRERLADPASKAALLDILRMVEADPGIVGISGNLMAVASSPSSAASAISSSHSRCDPLVEPTTQRDRP
jgi:hypothetical protein